MKPSATLDHIVVTAPNLKAGVEWIREILGATPELGGKHACMGTHNCLLRLGENTYLEVISPDPNADPPARPRWFGLDDRQDCLNPRLAGWVARSSDVAKSVSVATEQIGQVERMNRGMLNWLITLTEDGNLLLGGGAPLLIQWQSRDHPARHMRKSGCTLVALEIHTVQLGRMETLLNSIGHDGAFIQLRPVPDESSQRLVAVIELEDGQRVRLS